MKKLFFILFTFFSLNLLAQEKQPITAQDYSNTEVEMADKFREDGKIYVVVSVLVVLLIGVFAYVIKIDQKISKIEKEIDKDHRQSKTVV